ncbi:hypothetical protein [Rheinheimera sp. WS51]|uniref:hypothetical protein n=1 Tax=Rheinheimera sp. WS51 TaxID=3425886 RepID=UPI003D92F91D
MKKSVIALVVVAAAAGGFYFANQKAEEAIKEQIVLANQSYIELAAKGEMPLIALSYKDVSANVLTSSYSIQDLAVSIGDFGNVATVSEITATGIKPKQLADKGEMTLTGLKAAPAALQMLPPNLSAFVQSLEIHGDYSYAYKNDGSLQFSQATHINDEFSLSYNFSLANMQQFWQYAKDVTAMPTEQQQALTTSEDYPEQMLKQLITGALSNGEIVLANNGFLQRLAKISAESGQGADFETMQGMALIGVSSAEQVPAAIKENLIKFINNPEKLALSFSFAEPLKFSSVENGDLKDKVNSPEDFIQFANLNLTAN